MPALQNDFLPGDLQPILQKNNIDGSIAVQAVQNETETKFLLDLAAENTFIKGVVGWTDLNAPDVEEKLSELSHYPLLKGFRHTIYDEKGEFLNSNSFLHGISKLKKYNFTFDLLVFEYQLNAAIKLVEKFPDQPFILDHLAKPTINSDGPSQRWIENIKKLASNKNVFAKLSGIVSLSNAQDSKEAAIFPYLEVMLDTFGTERLMFGSDWPVCKMNGNYEKVLGIVEDYFSAFPEKVKGKVYGGNAVKFYNL